jgi:hypothetical protein
MLQSDTIPPQLTTFARREFAGERMVWAGQPSPRAAMTGGWAIWLFAVPWTAFALFWEATAVGALLRNAPRPRGDGFGPAFMVLWGIPFVLLGLAMLLSPFWLARQARRSVYVLTDKRLALLRSGFRGTTVRSVWPAELLAIERTEAADGSGTLKLDFGTGKDKDGDSVQRLETIRGIPEVRKLERLLLEMRGRR